MGDAKARSDRVKKKLEKLPDPVTHRLVADKLGVPTETVRDWVAKGVFPGPHSVIEYTWFYRLDAIEAFLASGKWPDGTKFRRGGPEGPGRAGGRLG